MPEPTPQTDTDRSVLRDVAARGWHSVAVAERNDQPGWAFTIGLQRSFEHPEVVAFGLPGTANQEVVERVARWIPARIGRYVCVCPVHSVVLAHWDRDHRRALEGASLNTADGMPVVWAQRLFGHRGATRVYGPTLMWQLLDRAAREGWQCRNRHMPATRQTGCCACSECDTARG